VTEALRIVIADDEAAARSRIRKLLRARAEFQVVAEATNGKQAVAAVLEHSPDVLFLDVQMPGLDGFGVIEALPVHRLPAVVFVTAYDQYALRAFAAQAVDYLLKPFDDERFGVALSNVRRRIREGRAEAMREALLDLISEVRAGRADAGGGAEQAAPPRIPVPGRDGIVLVEVGEIAWIEAAGDYACLHAGATRHLIRGSLAELERRLGGRFVRIHRSALVRKDAVKKLSPRSHGDYDVMLEDGTTLRLTRQHRAAFGRALDVDL
jgi:two-component system LytT family response regulator